MSIATNMKIECIDHEVAFLNLRDDWEALRLISETSSCFLSHDWVRCCWEELKPDNAMRVFVVRNGGRSVLIAPCMLSQFSEKRFPVTSLTFITHPETQISDMLILQESQGCQAVIALLHYLLTERAKEWSLLLFDKLPSDSLTVHYLRESLGEVRVRWQSAISHESLIVSLDQDWQEYLAEKSPRFRKTLRNVGNRIAKCGRVRVRTYEGKRAAEEAIEKLFAVSDASWKVADGIAITSSTQRMRFFKELMDGAATAERVRIVLLEVDGKPIASETQIIDGGVVYALRSDYDDRYADSSPGSFLQIEILKELFASPYREYNFGVGLNPYKSRWTEQRRQLLRFRIYNQTLRGRFLDTAYRWEPKMTQLPGARLLSRVFSARSQ
jgi:CelD/BcsL family acetyltransferase involved in cellulose biosynthesis